MSGTNRLAQEKSPYLLQHAHNPVDWYPWGEEAFKKAAELDRPIFLSIGYSSCHWCHVMERESFEDERIAGVLNQYYISIKVDREERPDIDELYMRAAQMMTGTGGWPLTIIMTAERAPFFAATYLPPTSRGQMMGLLEVLTDVADKWKVKRAGVERVKEEVLRNLKLCPSTPSELDWQDVQARTFEGLKNTYESRYGGFELEPKFPSPHKNMFLLRHWRSTGSEQALEMATWTLRNMAMGGIHDHLGGGFHRYSTDRRWWLPHFEKMLYDQAMLSMAYGEAYQATQDDWMREMARQIVSYALRDLHSPEGAFYSSEDADSEGEEGKFYTWRYQELHEALGAKDVILFGAAYNTRPAGNYRDPMTGDFNGRNVLYRVKDDATLADDFGLTRDEVQATLDLCLKKLEGVRRKKVRPGRDEKVLLDWNGLMLAALAKVGRVCQEGQFIDQGRALIGFVEKNMRGEGGGLLHRYSDGEAGINGFLSDYAYYGWGLLEMHQATLDERYLDLAKGCADQIMQRFPTPEGGFFMSMPAPDIIARGRGSYDGAIPSGNSVAHLLLSQLGVMMDEPNYAEAARGIVTAFGEDIKAVPQAFCFLAMSMVRDSCGYSTVGISGSKDAEITFKRPLEKDFVPEVLWHRVEEGMMGAAVCKKNTCLPPANDVESLRRLLEVERKERV
ncbi:MAG: hypothetical protein A4E32_01447 [Methanomassiliicoccales archaeon PtaU1.Bin124]|nr:MAG: hypothetical protein A4E32_01447 [Methanomassiliicoccales archaeon PtaU1.Bin124]